MSAVLPLLLSVMLLEDPSEVIDAAAAAAVSEDADRVTLAGDRTGGNGPKSARITSRTCDFDRMEGVVLFEGDVVVRYSDDYTMCSDRLYMFMSRSNELGRVVAVGNVTITNDTRTGYGAMATYRRRKNEVEIFGGGDGRLARLVERGEDASELEGTRIKFWLDAEQVEVENSRIHANSAGKGEKL